jgi:hypothetical protein
MAVYTGIKLIQLLREPAMPTILLRLMSALIFCTPAFASSTVGRWCDMPVLNITDLDNVITIYQLDDETFSMTTEFPSGESFDSQLEQSSEGRFNKVDTSTGDYFHVQQSTGHLVISDNQGYIRTATRLESDQDVRDCLSGQRPE